MRQHLPTKRTMSNCKIYRHPEPVAQFGWISADHWQKSATCETQNTSQSNDNSHSERADDPNAARPTRDGKTAARATAHNAKHGGQNDA